MMELEDHSDRLRVVGVDPGPVPGLVALDLEAGRLVEAIAFQCTANAAPRLLEVLLLEVDRAVVQVEKFVVGKKAARLGHAAAAATTRDLVGQLLHVTDITARRTVMVTTVQRPAAVVKPWATEARMARARLLEPTKAMRHARDAARHALYAAVREGGLPDPLSSRWAS